MEMLLLTLAIVGLALVGLCAIALCAAAMTGEWEDGEVSIDEHVCETCGRIECRLTYCDGLEADQAARETA